MSQAHADILILLSVAKDAYRDGEYGDAMSLAHMAWQRAIREKIIDLRQRAYLLFLMTNSKA